jgi:hypothetical protein
LESHSTIEQHKNNKGYYTTPLNSIPGMKPMNKYESWFSGRMPEYIWIAIILDFYGREEGLRKIAYINKFIFQTAPEIVIPRLSTIIKLSEEKQRAIYNYIKTITTNEIFTELTVFLTHEKAPVFSECFYTNYETIAARCEVLIKTINKLKSQGSVLTNDTRFCVIGYFNLAGKIHVQPQEGELLVKYQDMNTESLEYEMAASMIRNMEGLILMTIEHPDEKYLNMFWECISMMTDCKVFVCDFGESKSLKAFNQKVYELLQYLRELYVNAYPLDKKLEIFTGIITYSYKRLKEVDEHNLYTSISGRSCVRSLIENFILSKYLITFENKKPEIWEDFEYYGLGQIKKIVLAERQNNAREEESHVAYKYLDILLNEFTMEEFTDIDARGYFDQTNIRKKAELVDEKELYKLYYDYDSQYDHCLWGAIRESAMLKCDNSAHQYHLVPDIDDEQKLKTIFYDCIFIMKKMVSFYATQIDIPEELIKGVIDYIYD